MQWYWLCGGIFEVDVMLRHEIMTKRCCYQCDDPCCCIRNLHSDTTATLITAVNIYETALFQRKLSTASVQKLERKSNLLGTGSKAIVQDSHNDGFLWVCNQYSVMWTRGVHTLFMCSDICYAVPYDYTYCGGMCFYNLYFEHGFSPNMCTYAEAWEQCAEMDTTIESCAYTFCISSYAYNNKTHIGVVVLA